MLRSLSMRKPQIIAILAILIGLGVSGFSFYKQGGLQKPEQEFVKIPVLLVEVPAYSTITKADITFKEVPKGIEPAWAIKQPEEIVGKVANVTLHKDSPVNPEDISVPSNLPSLNIVSVNVDAARAAGAQQGDIVDIYWIRADQAGNVSASPVAINARVVEVCDGNGNPVGKTTAIQQSVSSAFKTPSGVNTIYRLLVKPEEVAGVVPGGSPKNNSVALVKKFSETKAPQIQPPQNPEVKKVAK